MMIVILTVDPKPQILRWRASMEFNPDRKCLPEAPESDRLYVTEQTHGGEVGGGSKDTVTG